MLTLRPDQLKGIFIPVRTGWLLSECTEAKGKQDLWAHQKPEMLAALRIQAIIQSVESSNRIEGVTVPAERLRPLVLGKTRPRDRSEEELTGYRKTLQWIFTRKRPVHVVPKVIRHLHAQAQGSLTGDAGRWKRKDNEIIEILPTGERRIRFRPTPAKETPQTVDLLCRNYHAVCEEESFPRLLALATFVFDLLCIHPFRDGNGRVSRLATTLLLLEHGFEVGRYVSLERLIEESKEDYYRVLQECSTHWHDGKNEIIPWWNYFLGILRQAYREFQRQMESPAARPAKGELVRQAVLAQAGPFTLAELRAQVPVASQQLIKKILGQMKRAGKIRLAGRGRGASWETPR